MKKYHQVLGYIVENYIITTVQEKKTARILRATKYMGIFMAINISLCSAYYVTLNGAK